MTILWIGLGGFLGTNARYFLGRAVIERYGAAFPWATLTINVLGSLAIGIVFELIARRVVGDPFARLVVVVGFLGGFTTFSLFALEIVSLVQEGKWARALSYALASNTLSVLACFVGIAIVRQLAQ